MYIVILNINKQKLYVMRVLSSLFVFFLFCFAVGCKDGDAARRAEIKKKVDSIKASVAPPPNYNFANMEAYYLRLKPIQRINTTLVRFDFTTVASLMTAYLAPGSGYTCQMEFGAFDTASARLYSGFYNNNPDPVTWEDVVNRPTFLLKFTDGTDIQYLMPGRVCPPPANCEYQ